LLARGWWQGGLRQDQRSQPPLAPASYGPRNTIEAAMGDEFDPGAQSLFNFVQLDRRSRLNACGSRTTGQICHDQPGLTGQRISLVNLRAAAIGKTELATLAPRLRDAIRKGSGQHAAGGNAL